jgi:hypothetical protein
MAINETVLEMHFHKPLMDLFRSTFGLGGISGVNFYKYSPQRECFIGFDQAYVKTDLSEDDFFDILKHNSMTNNYQLNDIFIGYFLQFKVVKEMQVFKKYTPSEITNRPHYRVTLDTTKNINTNLSQHELLYNLNRNFGAMVYYACPMLFERALLYEVNVDLDLLRLADLNYCPSQYSDNENHFIYFNDVATDPVWCSEPTVGKAITPKEMAELLLKRIRQFDFVESAQKLLKLLTNIQELGLKESADIFIEKSIPNLLDLVHESLTVIRVTIDHGKCR